MSHLNGLEGSILDLIPFNIDQKLILDEACGGGSWGFSIRLNKNGNPLIVGIDIFKQSLKRVKGTRVYDHLICADIRALPFKGEVFDFVLSSEVIEHVPLADGCEAIKELERVSAGRVIISTPLDFVKQGIIDGNTYQQHVSNWQPNDFTNKAYEVMVVCLFKGGGNFPPRLRYIMEKTKSLNRIMFLKEIVAWKEIKPKKVI